MVVNSLMWKFFEQNYNQKIRKWRQKFPNNAVKNFWGRPTEERKYFKITIIITTCSYNINVGSWTVFLTNCPLHISESSIEGDYERESLPSGAKQALQKGPKFGTWSQMGPKCQNGPKKVPILLPSPKFLILPSDDAEKGRHIAVSHCCALFGHLQCIMCMSLILSGPLIYDISTDRY